MQTVLIIIVISWVVLGLVGGILYPLPSNPMISKRHVLYWTMELFGGGYSLYLAIVMIILDKRIAKRKKREDLIKEFIEATKETFEKVVVADLENHLGGTVEQEFKEDFYNALENKLLSKLNNTSHKNL